jgi:hypothetical protein
VPLEGGTTGGLARHRKDADNMALSLRVSIALGSLLGLGLTACSSKSGGTDEGTGAQTGVPGPGGVALASCDLRTETSANPITEACGDITSPLGVPIELGQYGAVMEPNVGLGFENTVNAADVQGNPTCTTFAALFNEDQNLTNQLLDTAAIDFALYTVYRPANWPAGKIPVISWGNGTCAQPEGYGSLLRYIASQGFFVVAANSRWVGSSAEIKHGLDFAEAANADPTSPYYGHLDTTKMGVMGHSQGSAGAGIAASDPRVSGVILFNGGNASAKTFLAVSGDLDVGGTTMTTMKTAVDGAQRGAFLYFHNPSGKGQLRGHLVLMMTPERLTEASGGFWKLVFNEDATARTLFAGENCGLCGQSADFDYGQKGL